METKTENNVVKRFNSRSREGSDPTPSSFSRTLSTFQFTLPRGERLGGVVVAHPLHCVSIHAPARGATWHHYIERS